MVVHLFTIKSVGVSQALSATSIPSFANMDATSRRALIEEVASDTFTAVQGFVEGGALVFDMSTNVVVMS